MSIKFKVKMTEQAMYDFLLYHNYTHLSGLVSTIFGVVCLGVAIKYAMDGYFQGAIIFGAIAVVMLFIEPLNMKQNAKRQVKNSEMFQHLLKYEISDKGVSVTQAGKTEKTPWESFSKAVSTNKSIILYVTRVRAIILPKECMGHDYMAVVEMISKNMPANKVKIRHVK